MPKCTFISFILAEQNANFEMTGWCNQVYIGFCKVAHDVRVCERSFVCQRQGREQLYQVVHQKHE